MSKSDHFMLDETTITLPELREGCTGQAVRSLQALLLNAGIDVGPSGIDGIDGPDTWLAVCDFQRAMGLPVTGVPDGLTWADLLG